MDAEASKKDLIDQKTRESIFRKGITVVAGALSVGVPMCFKPSFGFFLVVTALVVAWLLVILRGKPECVNRRSVQCLGFGVVALVAVALGLFLQSDLPGIRSNPTAPVSKAPVSTTETHDNSGSAIANVHDVNGPVHIEQSIQGRPEEDLTGILMPSNEPDPYPVEVNVPADAVKVFLSSNLVWFSGLGYHRIFSTDANDILAIKVTANGLYVCASLRRADNREVVHIYDNKFVLNPNVYFKLIRPDRHELRVLDKAANLALRVRYVNEHAIAIQGEFYMESGPPIIMTEQELRCHNLVLRRGIMGQVREPVFLVGDDGTLSRPIEPK